MSTSSTTPHAAPSPGSIPAVATPTDAVFLAQREFHPFEAGGETFLYLVPSAAVFYLDEASHAVLQSLDGGPAREDDIVAGLAPRYGESAVRMSLGELMRVQAIGLTTTAPETFPRVLPQANFPLTTLVLNVTNKCNLACTYCYEYGEDKIVDTTCDPAPAYMSEETARKSVDFMFEQSGELPVAHLTFFGGETLLNFKVLKKTAAYARERAKELGKDVDFFPDHERHAPERRSDRMAGRQPGRRDRQHRPAPRRPRTSSGSSRTEWGATTTRFRRSRCSWSGTARVRSGPG